MSRRKTINLIFCSVLPLVGCTESGQECEAADMMMIWCIIAVSSLLLFLFLAYFLWRSYKYNNVLADKYERLQAVVGEASKLCDDSIPQRLEASPTTSEYKVFRVEDIGFTWSTKFFVWRTTIPALRLTFALLNPKSVILLISIVLVVAGHQCGA